MDALAATAGLIAVGALTPGPNNLIVLRESARLGWRGALPAGTGVVAGGLALLVAGVAGARGLFDRAPWLATAMSATACLLLAALGIAAIARSLGSDARTGQVARGATAGGFWSLFVFQFLNPKAWLLVVAALASVGDPPAGAAAVAQIAVLFIVIPALGLALWSFAGARAQRLLDRRPVRIWFDRVTGALFVAFAALLFLEVLDAV